jgi:flagellar basal-body rod modification protein FlgD
MINPLASNNPYESLGLGAAQEEKKDQGALGLEQFLKIMTTQLKSQDPLEPMDNGDFLGQIAQFGTVTGIENLNESFNGFSNSITSGQALQAGSLVGREVLAPVRSSYLETGSSIKGRVNLPTSTSALEITVTDDRGQLVRTMQLGAQPSGPVEFTWDGINNDGDYAQAGTYSITVTSGRGYTSETLQTNLYNKVHSVTMGGGIDGLSLNLAGSGQLPFSSITAIK